MTAQHPEAEPGPRTALLPLPTRKQLAYLRALANRTGQSFAYPGTRRDATREIRRLKTVKPSTRLERMIERLDLDAEQAARNANCNVPVDLDREITGYGANCRWSH